VAQIGLSLAQRDTHVSGINKGQLS